MKRVVLTVLLGLLVGCGGGGGGSNGASGGGGDQTFTSGGGTPDREAIDNYVNGFIIPLLRSLDSSAAVLSAASQDFASNPNSATLAAVRSAWVATRLPWENSETALFGPVDFYGFDPALDSWPVNQADLENVLNSGQSLNVSTVNSFDNTLKGFHTIEYLIYGAHGQKTAAELTERESEYLVAVAGSLKGVTSSLLSAWVSGYGGQSPYALEVVKAGQGSASFPSERSAIEQFVRGIMGICDEVANGKIADPFNQRNPNIVESQFSGNSLTDFANNIDGAKSAYVTAISDLVAAANPALDTKVKAAFDNAIGAIRAIPEPFLDAIQSSSNDGAIRNAQTATRNVLNIVESEVLPTVLN